MKRLSRMLAVLVVMAMLLVLSAGSVFAEVGTNWNEAVITVEGAGVAPPNARNAMQARLMARRAAIVDGYRQLAEAVKGVQVDSETTVENMMVTNDIITTRVSALVQGAKVVSEQAVDGGYMVTMQISMFGVSDSLASAVLPKHEALETFPEPIPSVEPSQTSIHVDISVMGGGEPSMTIPSTGLPSAGSSAAKAPAGKAYGQYTGLIVDCTGLGLKPVMSPVIKNANGDPIYGYKNLDYDRVVANGMAGYTTDLSRATRAGSNPLVVRAIGLDGHNANPVLSLADANRVLIENGTTHFLDKTNVVFIR